MKPDELKPTPPNSPAIEQLLQLVTATGDGNLISKDSRDWLVKAGYVERMHGYNFLTNRGIETLVFLRLLVP